MSTLKKKQKTRNRGNTKNQKRTRRAPNRQKQVLIVRGPFPRRARTTLQFVDYNYLANVGALYNSQRYSINNAFNIAAITSGSLHPTPSVELFAFYNTYRVIKVWIRFKFINNETFPQQCMIFPSLTDLGANYSTLYAASLQEFGRRNSISAKTGIDTCTLITSFNMRRLIGDPSYMFNPAYTGSTSGGTPSITVFMNWGTLSTNNIVSGVEYEVTARLEVELFNQDILLS